MKIGDKFGRLKVIGDVTKRKVECECECGTVKPFYKANLRNGRSRSCGCLFREMGSRLMTAWNAARKAEKDRPGDSVAEQGGQA